MLKIDRDGNRFWYNAKGELHRKDGPAIEINDGAKSWWLNGELYREDGPAIEFSDGTKFWYLNDDQHRMDGPAVEGLNGYKEWYLDGNRYTEEEYREKVSGKIC